MANGNTRPITQSLWSYILTRLVCWKFLCLLAGGDLWCPSRGTNYLVWVDVSWKWSVCLCVGEEVVNGCRLQAEHKSPYVTAWLSQPVPAYGCISRELVPTTRQQVDVLLFNASSSSQQTSRQQHTSTAWITNTHLRQHIYLTLKQSANFGMLSFAMSVILIFVFHEIIHKGCMKRKWNNETWLILSVHAQCTWNR